MSNNHQELVSKIKFRRSKLEEEPSSTQAEHIPTAKSLLRRLDPTDRYRHYIRIARTFITKSGTTQGIQRVPGAETPALITELAQRIRETNWIIAAADQEIERLEPRAQTHEETQHIRGLQNDRDKLTGALEFYKDLKEALESTPVRLSQEEIQKQRNRSRDWADARLGRR
jgi:hypothetical protein